MPLRPQIAVSLPPTASSNPGIKQGALPPPSVGYEQPMFERARDPFRRTSCAYLVLDLLQITLRPQIAVSLPPYYSTHATFYRTSRIRLLLGLVLIMLVLPWIQGALKAALEIPPPT